MKGGEKDKRGKRKRKRKRKEKRRERRDESRSKEPRRTFEAEVKSSQVGR